MACANFKAEGCGCVVAGFLPGASRFTLTYQNLQKSRVPINSIFGFIIRTYKKSRVWSVKVGLHMKVLYS